jgi:hypothetical protein
MPARRKGLRLIVVNGFDETMFEMEKSLDKNADLTQWKRELVVSFGGRMHTVARRLYSRGRSIYGFAGSSPWRTPRMQRAEIIEGSLSGPGHRTA